jgi:hypothetical protein
MYPFSRRLVGPRAALDTLQKKEFFFPYRKSSYDSTAVKTVVFSLCQVTLPSVIGRIMSLVFPCVLFFLYNIRIHVYENTSNDSAGYTV